MSIYSTKPSPLLTHVGSLHAQPPLSDIYCAGFELKQWRCNALADHLLEWLPEYALPEQELDFNHGNAYTKLKEAAVRVYTSKNYASRGEAGEIALHAICRTFFGTIPISPRVFYKSTANDVVKSFDLVHARFDTDGKPELWLGESKLYEDSGAAIGAAIASVKNHLEQGFLNNQKAILGPQIPKTTPHYEKLRKLFSSQSSIDDLLGSAVFVIGILGNSNAAKAATTISETYKSAAIAELAILAKRLKNSGLTSTIRLHLVYVPLATKTQLINAFDAKLKALQ